MEQPDETLLSVVVLELGSTWPPWLAEYQAQAPNSMVIAQSADESASTFAQRIGRKMDEVGARDVAIHAGLLVSNGALDSATVAARQAICDSLLRIMLKKQRGELVLASDVTAGDAVRHQLFALAGTLCDELRGTRVSVRVRFDTLRPAPAVSGVMKSVTPNGLSEPHSKRDGRASNSR
ncbi:MAG TPA: hypothetical protein VER11_18975 [Polyangiaceae bacterium]|nr:hypothetical protein [Polyangiaceae bacterium]